MKKEHMSWEEADSRTTSVGLARYAYEYIEAAILVNADADEKTPNNAIAPIPAYFLATHGIELTFKAFLRFRGVSVRTLTLEIGHSLDRCNEVAKGHGLEEFFKEHPRDSAALELLADLNGANHSLRYIRTGMKTFPLWSLVEPLAVRLHQAVAPVAGYKSFEGVTFSAYETPW